VRLSVCDHWTQRKVTGKRKVTVDAEKSDGKKKSDVDAEKSDGKKIRRP
jgi:hypothetical protein